MAVLNVPPTLNAVSAVEVVQRLPRFLTDKDFTIDFKWVRFVEPFAALLSCMAIKQFVDARHKAGIATNIIGNDSGLDGVSYLNHSGVFRELGVNSGYKPGQAFGSPNYVPLTKLDRSELTANGQVLQVSVDTTSDRLSAIIFPGDRNAGAAMMLSYCLREIIRNAFEHAGVDCCYVMAQRVGETTAEITIGDAGAGIYTTIRKRYNVSNPDEAIILALQPGITSSTVKATDGDYDNSGFGLYVTSEVGKRYGSFAITSSRRLFAMPNNNLIDVPLNATIVKLCVNAEDGDLWPNILKMIVFEGEAIAKKTPGASKSASKSSKDP